MKTDDIPVTLPQFIVDSTANRLLPEILNELAIAKSCRYRFQLLVSDPRLYRKLLELLPQDPDFLVGDAQGCRP